VFNRCFLHTFDEFMDINRLCNKEKTLAAALITMLPIGYFLWPRLAQHTQKPLACARNTMKSF